MPRLMSRVRIPSPAPIKKPPFIGGFFIGKEGVGFEPGKRVRLPAKGERKCASKRVRLPEKKPPQRSGFLVQNNVSFSDT